MEFLKNLWWTYYSWAIENMVLLLVIAVCVIVVIEIAYKQYEKHVAKKEQELVQKQGVSYDVVQ